jgi:hypothetical protein
VNVLDLCMVITGIAELVFAALVYVFIKRLLQRSRTSVSEEIGSYKKVMRKLRTGEPMSHDEIELARQTIAERRSPLAYSIPAAVFTLGCFYVFGSLDLHGIHTLRVYIGLFPILGSINLTIQLLRVATLKKRLTEASGPARVSHRSPTSNSGVELN